jgi:hypothetical protein
MTRRVTSALLVFAMATAMPGVTAGIETEAPSADILQGIIIGKVYELDHEDYRRFVERLRKEGRDPSSPEYLLDGHEYLTELSEAVVNARQLQTNEIYVSATSTGSGDYIIRPTPAGAFDFSLVIDDEEYQVEQRLDLNVDLSYIAELCFVVDREDKKAWVVAGPERRPADSPAWLPFECSSPIRGCLAMLFADPGGLPPGLLLLLAGGGATAGTLGILATTQTPASSTIPPP